MLFDVLGVTRKGTFTSSVKTRTENPTPQTATIEKTLEVTTDQFTLDLMVLGTNSGDWNVIWYTIDERTPEQSKNDTTTTLTMEHINLGDDQVDGRNIADLGCANEEEENQSKRNKDEELDDYVNVFVMMVPHS